MTIENHGLPMWFFLMIIIDASQDLLRETAITCNKPIVNNYIVLPHIKYYNFSA